MIDGVLQLDLPTSSAATPAADAGRRFIIGTENGLLAPPLERLLAAASQAGITLAAARPTDPAEADAAAQFNPLVVVGPPGSGKSHIAQGLVRAWTASVGADPVAYFTAADFGRERQAAEAEGRLETWRERLRGVGLLVVEDIDRLRLRATIQRELRETVDAIIAAGGGVVITAARAPLLCRGLDVGLRDRLVAGLTVRLERPGLAARRAILAQAAAARGVTLEPEQVERLAQRECATPAQLIGRLNEQLAKPQLPTGPRSRAASAGETGEEETRLGQRAPDPSPSRRGGRSNPANPAALKQILAVVARYFGVTQAAITSKSRRTSLVEARNVVVHLARRLTDLSYAEIGRALGGRDHSTIMHANRRLTERLATDPAIQQAVEELDRIVGS